MKPLASRRVRRAMAAVMRGVRPVRRRIAAAPGPPSQIHLAWPDDPAHTLAILWMTGAERPVGCAAIRAVGSEVWRMVHAGRPAAVGSRGFLHRCDIADLDPGTAYEYRVSGAPGAAGGWSPVRRVQTAPARPGGALVAAFLSDVGIAGRPDRLADAASRVVAEIAADAPQLVLGGGDYAYANRDTRFLDPADAIDAWFDQMQPLFATAPFMPSFGNHDIALGEGWEEWAPRLALPRGEEEGRSYSFDAGAVHFCALFAPGHVPARRHLEWLDGDLAAARRAGAPWLVVYQHAPVFAHGASHPAHRELREALVPVLERHGVDLHLSAHDQSYERTFALRDGATRIEGGADRGPIPCGAGVVYAKISPSGKRSERGRDFSRIVDSTPPAVAVRSDACHHYGLLRADERRLEVEVIGIPDDGGPRRAVDRFAIIR
jgi:hypothetical protein